MCLMVKRSEYASGDTTVNPGAGVSHCSESFIGKSVKQIGRQIVYQQMSKCFKLWKTTIIDLTLYRGIYIEKEEKANIANMIIHYVLTHLDG